MKIERDEKALPTAPEGAVAPNGGRQIRLTGEDEDIIIDVLTAYAPNWERVYEGGSYYTYDGREIKNCIGRRFKLDFTTYGLVLEDVIKLRDLLMSGGEVTLECPEFAGVVVCDNFAPPIRSANFNGTYYTASISLSAVALEAVDGSL